MSAPPQTISPQRLAYLARRAIVIGLRYLPLKLLPVQFFSLGGRRYPYFYHRYNATWVNERCVEVPVVWEAVRRHTGQRMLEVGNVLSHYFALRHTIVDKFERAPGVLNQDILDYQPAERFDLIVTISTLEHVGWDETPHEPDKPLRALDHLRALLAPGGTLLVTIPLGYNPHIDHLINEGRLRFEHQFYARRISRDNTWRETDWNGVRGSRYDAPYPGANGLVIGIDGPLAR